MMKNIIYTLILILTTSLLIVSCSDETKEILLAYPTDITFEDITLDRFTYEIPTSAFTAGDSESGIITANVVNNGDGTFTGFAPSNRNVRHYPWDLSPDFVPAGGLTDAHKTDEINSTVMSCYTSSPNDTENFLVGTTNGDDASITLSSAAVVEHILVANTSFTYLTAYLGSIYSGTYDSDTRKYDIDGDPVANINILNEDLDMYGRFFLPSHENDTLVRLKDDDYLKLTIKGIYDGSETGSVDFYLAVGEGGDPANPEYDYLLSDWRKVDLTTLGTVDKLVFNISSSYALAPKYFCLDGIRIQK
jgi:hypothetical protein